MQLQPVAEAFQGQASMFGTAAPPGLSHVSGVTGSAGPVTPGVSCYGATACPCMGTPGYPTGQPPPGTPAPSVVGGTAPGSGHPDDAGSRFKATPTKLPRLDLRNATDSAKSMLAVENWLFLCNSSLKTWGVQAVNLWQAAV
eukprot:5389897-Amphidinium_carterae.2